MEADSFRAGRVEKLDAFEGLVDFYCEGDELRGEKVKRMTGEEFYKWLDKKIERAKREKKEIEKLKGKS